MSSSRDRSIRSYRYRSINSWDAQVLAHTPFYFSFTVPLNLGNSWKILSFKPYKLSSSLLVPIVSTITWRWSWKKANEEKRHTESLNKFSKIKIIMFSIYWSSSKINLLRIHKIHMSSGIGYFKFNLPVICITFTFTTVFTIRNEQTISVF